MGQWYISTVARFIRVKWQLRGPEESLMDSAATDTVWIQSDAR